MEQLVSMGFSDHQASLALSATGGDSPEKAVDWILSNTNSQTHTKSNPNPSFQPKLDRFFKIPVSDSPPTPTPKRHKKTLINMEPLSQRMRPRSLDDVVGQDHVVAFLRRRPSSLILWGPPGSGKTSLALSLSLSSPSPHRFVSLSAVSAGVSDIRDAVAEARKAKPATTLLFVDEIHRFSKPQQDSFLPVIEDGTIVLLGATTENPSFHVSTPLLSRCRVLLLRPLSPAHVASLIRCAASDPERGLAVEILDEAVKFVSENCDGDARVGLNALEAAGVIATSRAEEDGGSVVIRLEDVREAMQCKHLAYDKKGEEHYNVISALHKSMRGGDANAALYWLARMLESGEEPLYIARRLIRFASEDVGLADPSALSQAVACQQACHFLGMPECNVVLAQCVAYMSLAPKSVAVYRAIGAAQKAVRESAGQNEGVPLHLRNAPTKLMKDVGYGKGYIYTPDDPSAFQSFLPKSLAGHKFLEWPDHSAGTTSR